MNGEYAKDEKWQEVGITMLFPVKMYPGSESHLRHLAMTTLRQKGLDAYEEDGRVYIK
jgi:hypothetical protein